MCSGWLGKTRLTSPQKPLTSHPKPATNSSACAACHRTSGCWLACFAAAVAVSPAIDAPGLRLLAGNFRRAQQTVRPP